MTTKRSWLTTALSRRDFVALGVTGCACALCPATSVYAKAAKPAAPIDVGPLSKFSAAGVNSDFADDHDFFVIRQDERLYAVTTRCTHKGGHLVARSKDGGSVLRCPRHGSRFDVRGDVVKGPARRPLARLGVSLDGRKHVVVDPSRRFEKDERDAAGSFIDLRHRG